LLVISKKKQFAKAIHEMHEFERMITETSDSNLQ